MGKKTTIFHIVTLGDLKANTKDNFYKPANFETDGFIHCTGDKSSSLSEKNKMNTIDFDG